MHRYIYIYIQDAPLDPVSQGDGVRCEQWKESAGFHRIRQETQLFHSLEVPKERCGGHWITTEL